MRLVLPDAVVHVVAEGEKREGEAEGGLHGAALRGVRDDVKVNLLDLDQTGFPNLALMRLSTWLKSHGHDVILNGAGKVDQVYASAVFSWNRASAEFVEPRGGQIGGTGVSLQRKLPAEVESCNPDYSLYGIDYGLGFLQRGCIRRCEFCVVPEKEGNAYEASSITGLMNRESDRDPPFIVLLDNEFFWKVKWALSKLEEFIKRGIDFCPSQGLDIRCVTPALAETLAASPYWNVHHTSRQITFAFDDSSIEKRYRKGVEELLRAGIPPRHLQSFVLVGFNSTIEQDLKRIEIIREYGIDPFVMVYRDWRTGQPVRGQQHRNLARWVNRRLYKVCAFEDYWPEQRRGLQGVMDLATNTPPTPAS